MKRCNVNFKSLRKGMEEKKKKNRKVGKKKRCGEGTREREREEKK